MMKNTDLQLGYRVGEVEPQLFFTTAVRRHNDKKENQIFLIFKEIQNGAVAKSYMTKGLLIYEEIFAHFLTH
jgi:hypothetical protein